MYFYALIIRYPSLSLITVPGLGFEDDGFQTPRVARRELKINSAVSGDDGSLVFMNLL